MSRRNLLKMDLLASDKTMRMATTRDAQLATATARDGVDTRKKDNCGTAAAVKQKTTHMGAGDHVRGGQLAAWHRMRILKRVLHWKQLDYGQKKANVKRGANSYAFDYMRKNAGRFVRLADVQEYCSEQHKKKTGSVLGDPPRSFEILRKDRLPLEWDEFEVRGLKYVKYAPHKKAEYTDTIVAAHKNRGDGFSKQVIAAKLEHYGHKCAITGLPVSEGALAADHWVPKEKGGLSEPHNCVILNKVLNEKKNNMMPVEWFATGPLKNFLDVCKATGMDMASVKEELMRSIQDS